MNSSETYV
jgi:alpha 1,3-glucosidase